MSDEDYLDEDELIEDDSMEAEIIDFPATPEVDADPVHIIVKRHVLLAMLDRASGILPNRDVIPVLKNYQVIVRDGVMTITATDMALTLLASTELVEIKTEGEVVLPGKALSQIVKEASGESIEIRIQDGSANIVSGQTNWALRLLRTEAYPTPPDVSQLSFTNIDRQEFLSGLEIVSPSASTDTNRPNLCLVACTSGKMSTSDGVRCAQIDMGEHLPVEMQIPISAVGDLIRLMKSTDVEEIYTAESVSHYVFTIGNDNFFVGKSIYTFPDIEEQLIAPTISNDMEMHCDREELISAIRRVRIAANVESSAIALRMDANHLVISTRNEIGDEASESIDCNWNQSESYEAVVNHNFLTDLLRSVDASTCNFFFGEDKVASRKTHILHRSSTSGMETIGVISQMRADWMMA